MRNSIVLAIFLIFSLSACKQDSKSTKTDVATKTEKVIEKATSKGSAFSNFPGPNTSTSLRAKAQAVLDYRREHEERKFWPILESGVWKFVFVFNGNKMEKPSKDIIKWMDFKQDGTFDYGEGNKLVTSGQYNYDLDIAEIMILDNDEKTGPQAWKVNMVGTAMVLLGNTEFANSAYQIKLEKMESRPQ